MGDPLAGWLGCLGWLLVAMLSCLAGWVAWQASLTPEQWPGSHSTSQVVLQFCLCHFQNLQTQMAKRKALGPHSNPFWGHP